MYPHSQVSKSEIKTKLCSRGRCLQLSKVRLPGGSGIRAKQHEDTLPEPLAGPALHARHSPRAQAPAPAGYTGHKDSRQGPACHQKRCDRGLPPQQPVCSVQMITGSSFHKSLKAPTSSGSS